MTHFSDRLTRAVRTRGNPLCVGLDPRWESLPAAIRRRHGHDSLEAVAAGFEEFCGRVLELVAPLVAVVKPQAAFFEAAGPAGMAAMQRLLQKAKAMDLVTILDGKRNDIASTAAAYADAAFAGTTVAGRVLPVWQADAVTINPYLGRDAVEPFLASARRTVGGVFVLVRTSNPGAGLFQDLCIDGKPLYQHVGSAVAGWARESRGECGLGSVGAVVGATYPAEMALLRKELPEVFFLVPGFGTQGGGAEDVRPAFRADGSGAIVNSSRSVLFPFAPDDADWEARIVAAAKAAIAQLAPLCRP
jgi:orotidine-5'-phosphate decarboxylase